jgi:Cu+-exporting ATPase
MLDKRDPVCGVKVDKNSKYAAKHSGKTYYFDCEGCRSTFEADPERFVKKRRRKPLLGPSADGIPKCCHNMKR